MTLACIFADIVFTAIIGLPFLLVTAFLLNHLRSFKDLPPGPWALPFVGYTIFFSKKPQVALTNLSKKHGHIFSVNIGTETVIVLSSYKIIKEALINQANSFSHRVDFKNIKSTIVSKDKLIATLDDGKDFAFSILGDANFQKTVIESQITDEVKCLITTMKFHGGCLQEMDQLIQQSTTNAMCGVFTGHRFDYKDDVLQDILKLLVEMSKTVNLLSWKKALSINIGKFVTSTHAEKIDYMSELTKVMSKIVAKNERELKSGRENTFINVWLAEIEKQGMKIKNHLHRHSLKRQLAGLVITNYVFQTNTLLWGLMFLTKHPEIQLKVQNEIDIIIGKERIPTITDIEQMPYVRATILEIIRMRPILSLHFSYRTLV
uniref:Cytochrome P450 n=1 Tax=Strigamia maritima TaxID=126957 RepID=T1IXX8_STRMM